MIIKKIKRHGTEIFTYSGEVGDQKVIVVFEDGAIPIEGDLRVILGKMVTKNNQNFYYVKSYKEV